MFTAIYFLNAMVIVFALAIVAMVAYGIYTLFIMPNTPAVDAAQSRDPQH